MNWQLKKKQQPIFDFQRIEFNKKIKKNIYIERMAIEHIKKTVWFDDKLKPIRTTANAKYYIVTTR